MTDGHVMYFISINTVPNNYLMFTQVHSDYTSYAVDRTDIRMISLDISGQYIDVLMPIHLPRTESVFIAYDQVDHRVHFMYYMYISVD